MNSTIGLYERFTRIPFGKHIFSRVLTVRAPYFSTIRPLIMDLRNGQCTVFIKDRRSIRNHLGTVHAGAMCTLSELTAGLAVEATIPANLRWIPREMKVRYLKKAKGILKGVCSFDPALLAPGDVRVPFEIVNESDEKVLSGEIVFYISERKPVSR